ncbi:hypothetical protein BJ170DRAFT_641854 [Xylariales sp. AK1849]|nr:hypothetical protein BJ170DRAFT_641854 [Xylariales sp. AK1849]
MASPPRAFSPPAGSPPYPSSAQLPPSKKRGSAAAELSPINPTIKRRKASIMSATSAASAHPLRQTSFPPDESHSQVFSPSYQRSPSVDNMSLVSGSQVSVVPTKKKRGRKSKADRAREAADDAARGATPSAVNGAAASVISNTSGGAKQGADEDGEAGRDGGDAGAFEVPEDMASKSAARSKEQVKEEERHRALLKQKMSHEQFDRVEIWRQAKISVGSVRKYINSVTSQSVAANIPQAMQVVCKLFLGDMVEEARRVQDEWMRAGEKQTDLPDDQENEEGLSEQSKYRRRAPLRPDHLAEAYRRWRVASVSGGSGGSLMGWHQQTRAGMERFPAKTGGKRIFR